MRWSADARAFVLLDNNNSEERTTLVDLSRARATIMRSGLRLFSLSFYLFLRLSGLSLPLVDSAGYEQAEYVGM